MPPPPSSSAVIVPADGPRAVVQSPGAQHSGGFAPAGTPAWSLERRLPLVILALLVSIVTAFGVAAYREVRASTLDRFGRTLESLTRELANGTSAGTQLRRSTMLQLASRPAVLGALAGRMPVESLTPMLPLPPVSRDSLLLGWELWTASGTRVLQRATAALPREDSMRLTEARATASRNRAFERSPFYGANGQVHLWDVMPVQDGMRVVGMLAQLRRMGNTPATERTLRKVTGEDIRIYVANRDSREWATLAGRLIDPPFTLGAKDSVAVRVVDARGRPSVMAQIGIAGSPWVLVLASAEASILGHMRRFIERLVLIACGLLLIGTLAAWYLSRRLVRPLAMFAGAADAMAHGDYSQRVPVEGGAEIARLARTFNSMTSRIGDAHAVLAHQNAALQRANDAKARFLAMMSHELRTPLNAIGGYADLIALGVRGPTTPEQEADLVRIRRNKDHLLSIIGDILHFSRVDAGHVALLMTDVALTDMCAGLSDAIAVQFAEKGVTLVLTDSPLAVRADAGRLHQVLLNLLTNAFNFTSNGGRVDVTAAAYGDWVHIEVQDTGTGIPEDKLSTIFDPFVQADESLTRRVGGTGLGLAIARELTTAMGGTVSVESTVGVGSRFTVALPRA